MGYLLGIDIGTSGVRSLIVDEDGGIVGAATAEHPSYAPKPGWSEQDPEDWWRATVDSVKGALDDAGVSGKQVQGIGLSGQMHGATLLDENAEVLRPAILWNDQRTAAECDEINRRVGRDRLIELTCNPALTGFTAPKVLWVRNNEPDLYEKTRKVLLPKDYIRYRLSGTFATEVSDASGTLLFAVPERTWCDEVLEKLEIDKDWMPDCYESDEVSAQISASAARELGIPAGTPIVGGGGDQAAGATGNGIVRSGVLSATLGTSGVLFAFSDEVQTDPQGRVHTFCHAVRGKWHVMGVMLSAGGSLQWWRNEMSELESAQAREAGKETYDILCDEAASVEPGSEGLLFMPYLTGERTPHADPHARGGWVGLNVRHARAHMIRSVLEGVCFGMRDSMEIIREMGIPIGEIRISGGGARSPIWRQIFADTHGHDVVTINASEGPAYGVALLAAVGTGVFNSIEEACDATIAVASRTEVNPAAASLYEKYYAIYRRLYPALKDECHAITDIVDQLHGD